MKDIIEPVDTNDGLFHDGDPSTGAEGTIVYAKIMNAIQGGIIDIQSENKNILAEAKMTPDPSKNNQLLAALKALFLGNADPRIDGVLQKDKNLSDLESATEALKNLGVLNEIYPIGIVTWFAQNKDPNTLFPGTTWEYIGENRTVRLGSANGSDVMKTGGSDSVTLAVGNMPPHTHSFSANTSSFDYGTKGTSSFDYGTKNTTTNGAHNHTYTVGGISGSNYAELANGAGSNPSTSTNGDHYHSVAIGAHSHTVGIGAHSHSVSGTTGSSGSGTAFSVTNAFVNLMGWYRSA